jgi:hypothetical protein
MLTRSDCGPLFLHTILNVPDSGVIHGTAILDLSLLPSIFFSNVSENESVSVTRIGFFYSVPLERANLGHWTSNLGTNFFF